MIRDYRLDYNRNIRNCFLYKLRYYTMYRKSLGMCEQGTLVTNCVQSSRDSETSWIEGVSVAVAQESAISEEESLVADEGSHHASGHLMHGRAVQLVHGR